MGRDCAGGVADVGARPSMASRPPTRAAMYVTVVLSLRYTRGVDDLSLRLLWPTTLTH